MTSPAINAQGTLVYFGQTKGANVTATASSKANPCSVTATNTLAGGDLVVCASMTGMPEIAGRTFIVGTTGLSGSAFPLFNEDSTSYGAVGTAGIFNKWTLTAAAGADMFKDASSGGSQNNNLEVTSLTSTAKEYLAGLPDSPVLSFNMLPNPRDATFKYLRAAQKSRLIIPVLVKMPNPDTTATVENKFFWFTALGFVQNFVEFNVGVDSPYAASLQFKTSGGLEIY